MNDEEVEKNFSEISKRIGYKIGTYCNDKEIEVFEKFLEDYKYKSNLIEKQKAEIETLKRDFEIVDHECSRLEQEDIRKDKIINEMAKYIDEITEKIAREKGVEDFEFCDNKCADKDEYIECKQCIKEYFENKVKESK